VIGVAMRNEKRAADSRFRPANRPAEIEIPDRLTPGISASAWAKPSPSAFGNVRSISSRRLGPQWSASHMIAAPTTSISATSPTSRNRSAMMSLRSTPMTNAGIVATAISHASRRSGSLSNERSRIVAKPAGTSRTQSRQK
jgi:hypothetical protein